MCYASVRHTSWATDDCMGDKITGSIMAIVSVLDLEIAQLIVAQLVCRTVVCRLDNWRGVG